MPKTTLDISKELSLPLNITGKKIALLGTTGSGKSYAAMKLAEELLEASAQIVVLDPVGIWHGLRISADGKGTGFAIPIFGGLHGDVPLEPTAGALIADIIVDKRISAVVDISQMDSDAEAGRFATAFIKRLYERRKAQPFATFVFLEECLSSDTEILTNAGWKNSTQISVGDMAATFDPATEKYEFQPVEHVIIKHYKGEMVRLRTKAMDCLITPGHRAVIQRFQHNSARYKLYPWGFCEAKSLPLQFKVPCGNASSGPGLDVSNETLRQLGWIITDRFMASKSRRYLAIEQSAGSVKRGISIRDEMISEFDKAGATSRSDRQRPPIVIADNETLSYPTLSTCIFLGRELSGDLLEWLGGDIHRIPRKILEGATTAQLRVLFNGLMEGDGPAKEDTWRFFYPGLNEALADDFQELATRIGIRTVKRQAESGQFVVSVSGRTSHWVSNRTNHSMVQYDGEVWCVRVKAGAFVARRNGKIFVTGNCQEFIPENPVSQGEVLCLHAFKRAGKIGRNFGIGFGLISQRPQEISKKVLNLSECVFAFQMNGKTEKDAIKAWLKSAGTDDVDADALPLLEVGHAHVWSPRWLKVSKEVKIAKKKTFDTSGTPELHGGESVHVKPLKATELEAISAAMAETVKKSKEDDPKELRKRIAQLEAAPPATVQVQAPAPPPKTIEIKVPVLKDEQITRLEALAGKLIERGELLVTLGNEITGAIKLKFSNPVHPYIETMKPQNYVWAGTVINKPSPPPSTNNEVDAGGIRNKQQEILNRLAELHSIKITRPPRIMVAMMVNYTNVKSPGFRDSVSDLVKKGMVEFPDGDRIRITPIGLGQAVAQLIPTTVAQFQQTLMDMLGGTYAKIIPILIQQYPHPMSRITLAGLVGYTNIKSPGFRDSISRMRELGFAVYPSGEEIVGTPLLFMKES